MSDGSKTETVKTILILKSNPMTLHSAEQFLRTRGWAVMSSTNLAESIQFLFENKIDYFIICANHPQKKVKNFPKILKPFPDLHLITYTDMANTPNMAILQEMAIPYQVLPPVSGPAIERTIFRIEKEVTQSRAQAQRKNSLHNAENSSERQSVHENLKKYFESENDDELPTLDSFNSNDDSTSKVESFTDYEDRINNQLANKTNQNEVRNKSDQAYPYLKDNLTPPIKESNASTPEFQKGVETALTFSTKNTDSSLPVEKIDRPQNCICFNIDSTSFKGFLVAAMGKNRRFDDELLSAIQLKLLSIMQNEGIKINENKPLDIKIRPVDFEGWALEKADFLKKSIHDGNEVAMAFFPHHKIAPAFGHSEADDMMSIDIDDLENDIPVTFDVYVHLPANNKYILYTPKNGLFLSSQKERLKAKGIDKMHTKKEFVDDIKKYHAENTLNKSIQDYEANSTKTMKKA